jgi:hypothetical protein
MRIARAAQDRTLRCWECGRRRAATQTQAGALQAIPPATGTIIGQLNARVIWDRSNLSCCKLPQPQYLTHNPRVSDYAFHLLLRLGFGNVVTRWRLRDGIACGLRPTHGPVAAGGRLPARVAAISSEGRTDV